MKTLILMAALVATGALCGCQMTAPAISLTKSPGPGHAAASAPATPQSA